MDTLDDHYRVKKNAQIRHCFPQRRGTAGAFTYRHAGKMLATLAKEILQHFWVTVWPAVGGSLRSFAANGIGLGEIRAVERHELARRWLCAHE